MAPRTVLFSVAALSIACSCQFLVAGAADDPKVPRAPQIAASIANLQSVGGAHEAIFRESLHRWSFQGIVVDEAGAPAPGATVIFHASHFTKNAQTGPDGSFSLTGEAAGNFVLIAKNAGGDRQAFQLRDPRQVEETHPAPVRLVLKKSRDVTIGVVDGSGSPVPDALVGASTQLIFFARAKTDSAGKAVLRVPSGLALQHVFALKDGVGFDAVGYEAQSLGGRPNPRTLGPDSDQPLKFELTGARTVRVHVADQEHKPIAGIRVTRLSHYLPKRAVAFSPPDDPLFEPMTDAAGIACFRFVPFELTYLRFAVITASRWAATQPMLFARSREADITTIVYRREKVTGDVKTVGGKPAAGATVEAGGSGYEFDQVGQTVKTDASGAFEFWLAPEAYYEFEARGDKTIAPRQKRVIRPGVPVQPLSFVLAPATHVHGRLVRAKDKSPVRQATVFVQTKDLGYNSLPESQQLPRPRNTRRGIGPVLFRSTSTDADGRFEFFLAPGKYALNWGPAQVEVTDQKEIVVDLVDKRPDRIALKGRVVLKSDTTRGVAGARVEGVFTDNTIGYAQPFQAVADPDGRFETTRPDGKMLVWASSGTLAGAAPIGAGDKTVVIPIAPTASATGVVIDQATGQPAANREIDFAVKLPAGGRTFRWSFVQTGTTDAKGRFSVKNLTVGLNYDAHVAVETAAEGPSSWHTVSVVTPKEAKPIDLGELDLPAPYRPPTLEKLISRAMESNLPLDARLTDDCHEARLFENNVLIVAASPKSAACRRFFSIRDHRDLREGDAEARDTLDNFRVLALDTSKEKNVADLRAFLAGSSAPFFPDDDAAFYVVDTEAHVVSAMGARELWPGKTMDAKSLTAFLNFHLPPMPDAQKRLADALAQARRENKRVLVEESAAWCSWCHVLAKYLDKHRSLVEKDYVWITVDPRFTHGKEIIKKLRPKAQGGIPWVVILDADGKPLVTSDGPEGNIGYPGEPKGVEHFEKMLRTTAQRLSDAEIKILLADALKK
jgi:Carboxypeptidase regulatory-like domain/Thioredoxin-like